MAAQGGTPRKDTEEWIIEMLRMRRASPHGKWIETTRRELVRAERRRTDSVRTSPPAMRQDSEMRATHFHSQAGLRTRQSRAIGRSLAPGRLPSHSLTSEQWRLERTAPTYRCGGS